ncbi:MarR family transcriptional regulator [Clostridium botulinum]|nr:MarR family transcriptional regulator [Clostridium botulinum]NFR14528.1 MarR family transcriptional regulator [Clostridium botulinum]NFR44926.1 MarR family transcriptional regulator [Clostridium botulinum]NFS51949.1 MarR family transcriptional regulator [Clostridium botulinum]
MMELNECINFLLTRSQQVVFQSLKSRLAKFEVTPVQYGILKCLWDEEYLLPKQIAEALSLDSSTITGLLDRMENKGLIERVHNKNDRRTFNVIVTEEGLKHRKEIEQVIEELNNDFLEKFSAEEKKSLKDSLRVIAKI